MVPEWQIVIYRIHVSSTILPAFDIPRDFKVGDYLVCGPLSYPDIVSYLACSTLRIVKQIA